ncbi:QRFP-like peptide receptor, partial [Lingula anatina]|uniref:QRFP-like peptide receptor n=1 Tax=Lingula anatina TaxID=7574 RepID=A0A1S3KDE3_LINAN
MGNNTPITEEQFKMLVSLYPESFLEPPLADHDLLRFRILFGIIMFCAVVFNILVIAVILRNKSMRTVTNTFLLSLAVSDLLIAAVCMPFQLYELAYQEWSLGEGLCRFYAYFQGVLIVSSILTLLIVAVDRYYAICHPLKARHVHTVNRALIITAVIWALSFTLMTPQLIVQKIDYKFDNKLPIRANVPYCREYFEHHWEILLYTSFTTFGFFLIPLIGIYVSYGR